MARLQCDTPLVYVLLIQLFSSLCYEVQQLSSLQSQIFTPLNFVACHSSLCRRSSCEEGARYFIFIFKETPGSSNLVRKGLGILFLFLKKLQALAILFHMQDPWIEMLWWQKAHVCPLTHNNLSILCFWW